MHTFPVTAFILAQMDYLSAPNTARHLAEQQAFDTLVDAVPLERQRYLAQCLWAVSHTDKPFPEVTP